jgi:hypothetical protein
MFDGFRLESVDVGEAVPRQGVWLLASRSAKGQVPQLPGWVTPTKRRIETVIGQLVERYHAKRI